PRPRHFTPPDGHAVLAAIRPRSSGVGSSRETFDSAGSQTITATDTDRGAIARTCEGESVKGVGDAELSVVGAAIGAAGAG
ncbi:hypothetical protein ABTN02_20575, partial [Acinetobacter baumannii]